MKLRTKNQITGYYKLLHEGQSVKELKKLAEKKTAKKWNPETFFDIDVVNTVGDQVYIQYRGYNEFAWIPLRDLVNVEKPPSASDALNFLIYNIKLQIKKGLHPGTLSEPSHNFRIASDDATISMFLTDAIKRGRTYTFSDEIANGIFGENWSQRIVKSGDKYCAYGVKFTISHPTSISEYAYDENGNTVPTISMNQPAFLICNFVRKFVPPVRVPVMISTVTAET